MKSWKTLALCAALALSPALASAQSTPGSMTTPPAATPPPATPPAATPPADQATKPADTQADAYQKERAACDKKDAAEQLTCRSAVDQKFNKKPMTAPQGQTSAPQGKSTY